MEDSRNNKTSQSLKTIKTMKKLLFATLFCLLTLFTAQAQTKEETIAWLQEKLQKYAYYDNDYRRFLITDFKVEVSECNIKFIYTEKQGYDDRHLGDFYNQYRIIPIDKLEILYDRGEIFTSIKNSLQCIKILSENQLGLTSYTKVKITPGEEDLANRLQKAVDHLATFCPKKKETF